MYRENENHYRIMISIDVIFKQFIDLIERKVKNIKN